MPSNVGRKATILYVGDVLMHSYLINGGETADGGYDYDYMFQQTKAFTEAADYAICNMEGTLGGLRIPATLYSVHPMSWPVRW